MNISISKIFEYFLSFLIIITISIDGQKLDGYCHQYCYSLDHVRPQTSFYSSKTTYFSIKRRDFGKHFRIANCEPVKIWLYIRHGARLPKAKEMKRLSELELLRDKIISNNYKLNGTRAFGAMCDDDLNLLRKWQWNRTITKEYDEFLTTQGWNDIKRLAQRYRQLFPNLFQNNYDEKKFHFRYTDVQRTEASYKAFVDGLFGENAHEQITVPPRNESVKLMKPYKYCASNEDKITGEGSEYMKYMNSNVMKQLVIDVSERLGFDSPLKIDQVFDMYDMCIYEHAWNISDSNPWCVVFTPLQIHQLEYLEDLRKYYECGYGIESNVRLLCNLMNDMLNHLGDNQQPKTSVYFTHSSSLMLLLTTLGVFKDKNALSADNYHRMSYRKWRLSNIAPLASNLAIVKYNCPNDINHEKIKFFLNEEPLEFDWCDMGLCDLQDVNEQFKIFSQVNCDEFYCISD